MMCSTETTKNAPKLSQGKDMHFEEKDVANSEKNASFRHHPQNDKEQSLLILRKVIVYLL